MTGSSRDQIEELAGSIAREQELSPEQGRELATRIQAADRDIWEAAMKWAKTGTMPSAPTVDGFSPAQLNERFWPSQVFTLLMGLRATPERAREVLKRMPGRNTPPGRRV